MDMVALVIGATGLVGSELTDQLLSNEQFERVKIFARRPLEKSHPKETIAEMAIAKSTFIFDL